jgi:hypothetical protein
LGERKVEFWTRNDWRSVDVDAMFAEALEQVMSIIGSAHVESNTHCGPE